MAAELDRAVRAAGARIIAALAARYRDIDLAEEAFADSCVRAAAAWRTQVPDRPDAWLYRTAQRCAVDRLRKRRGGSRAAADLAGDEADNGETMESSLIPDERLRLIFACCHPAVAPDARAALTLRVICGLSTAEIARAFLVGEATLAQRLVRAKRKIAEAGVPFEIPGPRLWGERLDAVLSTLEVAYSKAHEDSAGTGDHAAFGREMIELTRVLAELVPEEADVLAFAALVRFAEARRAARVDESGCMVPLSEQDPQSWDRALIGEADAFIRKALAMKQSSARLIQSAIHAAWCRRRSLAEPPPWPTVLGLYDRLVEIRPDAIVRLNRAVALAEVAGVQPALDEVARLDGALLAGFLPYHAVRADLLRRAGREAEAREAYRHCLSLEPGSGESAWLRRRMEAQACSFPSGGA